MSGPPSSNPLDVCDAVVATCTGNALKRQIQNLRRAAAVASWEERNLTQRHIEDAATRKESCKGEEHNAKESSGRTFLSKFTSPEQSYVAALRPDKQHQQPQARRQMGKSFAFHAAASAATGN
jgi:hypothetical protein